jgi:hypothetical protein
MAAGSLSQELSRRNVVVPVVIRSEAARVDPRQRDGLVDLLVS